MPRSIHGGRHELGQNFLTHTPTIALIVDLVRRTDGAILEIGAGDGALTKPLAQLGRRLTAIELDEHRARRLARELPDVAVKHADALAHPLHGPVIVGNIPFHLTTPLLRRLLNTRAWSDAILLTQWEVARKRAAVGGSTLMTAQSAPWFSFHLHARVPSRGFTPRPSVDGGVLQISRRPEPLIPTNEKVPYERFVSRIFTGRGGTLDRIIQNATGIQRSHASRILRTAGLTPRNLPRDIDADQWADLWTQIHRAS